MSADERAAAWLDPAFDLWIRARRLVDLVGSVLLVAGVGLGLVYIGAHLERRALKGQLTVLDGVDAVREAGARVDVQPEATDGDCG